MNTSFRMVGVWLILLFAITAAPAQTSKVQDLYEKAVTAYGNEDCVKALQLIDQLLKIAPEDKQAQKLKLVIEAALHPAVAAGAPDSLWNYFDGQNTLESDPGYMRVYHTSPGPVTEPSYATMNLPFNAKTTEYELIFRMRFGTAGDLPSGVTLFNGATPIVSFTGTGHGFAVLSTPDRTIVTTRTDLKWHEYHLWWRDGQVELRSDDKLWGAGKCTGMPNLFQFGGSFGRTGRQAEAYLTWVGMNYNYTEEPK